MLYQKIFLELKQTIIKDKKKLIGFEPINFLEYFYQESLIFLINITKYPKLKKLNSAFFFKTA